MSYMRFRLISSISARISLWFPRMFVTNPSELSIRHCMRISVSFMILSTVTSHLVYSHFVYYLTIPIWSIPISHHSVKQEVDIQQTWKSIESIKTVNHCKNRGIYHFLIIIPIVYVTSSLLNIIIFCITKLKCISYTTLICFI
jgi:hypothetical protein